MKKIVLLAVAVMMAASASIFAMGGQDSSAAKSSDKRPVIHLVTDATGIDDKSFNAAAWRGILEYYGDTWKNQSKRGKLYDVVTCQTQDQYVPTLKQLADNAPDLIIATGFTFADAISEVSDEYPEQKFVIIDVDWISKPNVREFVFHEEEGSYLVGVAAALQAKADGIANPKFGFIGGIPGATITKFEVGYIQGIKSVLPNAEIVDYYANDWGKPELAKTQAKNWYDNGVYAIFSAAGGTGNGTIAQAKEMRLAGKNVWAIGVDSDQYEDGIYAEGKSAVLTSMIKNVETAAKLSITYVADGNFAAGVENLALKDKGVAFSAKNPELKDSVKKEIQKIEADIISGKIKIAQTYKDALDKGLVPAGLGAKDN